MFHVDPLIAISSWSLDIEKSKAKVYALNVANSSTGQAAKVESFDELLQIAATAYENNNSNKLASITDPRQLSPSSPYVSVGGPVNLDEQIALLSQSAGRYKVIANAISKKLGFFEIVSKGK